MQFSPQELKDKLLKTLDADNNVVDVAAALEVISTLEKYPITQECLEQTRIGKIVNDLRKKTTSKELSKRAKHLLKQWQVFITNTPAPLNGERNSSSGHPELNSLPHRLAQKVRGADSKPASPCSRPATPSSAKSSLSPPSIAGSSQPATPSVHSRLSPRLLTPKPSSPSLTTTGNSHKPSHGLYRRQHGNASDSAVVAQVRPSTPTETVSKVNVANMRKRRGAVAEDPPIKAAKCSLTCDNSEQSHHSSNGESLRLKPSGGTVVNGVLPADHYSRSTTSRSNASQLCRDGTSNTRQVSPTSPPSHSCGASPSLASSLPGERMHSSQSLNNLANRLNSTSNKTAHLERTLSSSSLSRTPKVKTTAQLIQDLHSNAGMRLHGSETVTKIATNQIVKECDSEDYSVVPPEAKPRPRRKPGGALAPPPSDHKSLNKTRQMRVHQYLQQTVDPAPRSAPDSALFTLIKQDKERVETLAESQPAWANPESSRLSHPSNMLKQAQTEKNINIAEVDPWSLLPDLDESGLEDDEKEVSPPREVVEKDVIRVEQEQWHGVSGQRDQDNNWQDWTQTYSLPTHEGNLLHILPYVCLDL